MGNNAKFDDFLTVGEVTTTTTNATVTRVHHSIAGQALGSTVDGVFVVSVTDHLGSGSVSRSESGATAVQGYTPFGAIRGGGGNSLPTDLTFTRNPQALEEFPGCLRQDDPGTGLVDYNARAYDPLLGRFVMGDTILPGSGQLLNRYSYVGNNPTGFTDPSGHDPNPCENSSGGTTCNRTFDPGGETTTFHVEDYGLDSARSNGTLSYSERRGKSYGNNKFTPLRSGPCDWECIMDGIDALETGSGNLALTCVLGTAIGGEVAAPVTVPCALFAGNISTGASVAAMIARCGDYIFSDGELRTCISRSVGAGLSYASFGVGDDTAGLAAWLVQKGTRGEAGTHLLEDAAAEVIITGVEIVISDSAGTAVNEVLHPAAADGPSFCQDGSVNRSDAGAMGFHQTTNAGC